EIHVSDPRPSESNAIPSPGFHRIRRIPVGSDKILYRIRWDCSTWVRETEFHALNIQELSETIDSMNPLKWSNFVKLCRHRFIEYPHVFRRDAFHGAICNNAEKVRQLENEQPQAKTIANRTPTQLCIKSTNMASKFEYSILGIYMIGVSTT
ncbi:unnamed protein product, partial [Adineta ricciae]